MRVRDYKVLPFLTESEEENEHTENESNRVINRLSKSSIYAVVLCDYFGQQPLHLTSIFSFQYSLGSLLFSLRSLLCNLKVTIKTDEISFSGYVK